MTLYMRNGPRIGESISKIPKFQVGTFRSGGVPANTEAPCLSSSTSHSPPTYIYVDTYTELA